MLKFLDRISIHTWRKLALFGLALAILLPLGIGLKLKFWQLFAAPLAVVAGLLVVYDYKPLFYLMVAAIPLSIQWEVADGFTLDVATEPLMLVFLVVFILDWLAGRQFKRERKIYPFHLLIFLILFWTAFTTLTSEYPFRSFKFLLAKVWYLAAFIYMGEKIIQDPKQIPRLFWTFFIPLLLVVIIITIQHGLEGFSFETAHNIPMPFFANGVVYAATLVLFLPWCWYARTWYNPKSLEWYIIIAGTLLIAFATILTFKRGAWLALVLLPFIDLVIKRRLFDKLIYVGIVFTTLILGWLINDNKFYEFAPNYQKTVWHEGDLTGHLQATISGTEISSMERFYRWVAAKNMIADLPLTGSGPSTFNQVYKRYTDDAFRTYVSDNPEQSTTHNYFLQTFSEQGILGGLLFIGLCLYMLLKAARLYPLMPDARSRSYLMMALLSLITILFHSLLNELIEVDKIGAMFWLNLLILHLLEKWHESGKLSQTP